jgi:hypothetical protein
MRWVTLGEAVAIAALIVSGLGLWNSWRNQQENQPAETKIIAERPAIPLALRGRVEDGGRELLIAPVEQGHTLDSLTVTVGNENITVGSDGRLSADAFKDALSEEARRAKGAQSMPVRIDARYIEAGQDRRSSGKYAIRYRWEDGGLFDDRDVLFTALSRR